MRHASSAARPAPGWLAGWGAGWLAKPFDYLWFETHRSTRGIFRSARYVIAVSTAMFGVVSVLMLFGPAGSGNAFGAVWTLALLVVQAGYVWFWASTRPLSRRSILLFAVFADLGTVSVLATYSDPLLALFGCVLLAVIGGFVTYFCSSRVVVAHLFYAVSVIGVLGARAFADGGEHPATVAATTLTVVMAVAFVPLAAHVAWNVISHDAKRSALDPLTGVFNRRGWEDELEDLVARGRDERATMAVLVIDIDDFKRVNDEFGHEQGDVVIATVARRLVDVIGENGVVARTGGEEFSVAVVGSPELVGGTPDVVVRDIGDSRDAVPVTVSVGAATISPESPFWDRGPTGVVDAVRLADSMMYRAKAVGGDRAVRTTL